MLATRQSMTIPAGIDFRNLEGSCKNEREKERERERETERE